jgi:hypothetical protein
MVVKEALGIFHILKFGSQIAPFYFIKVLDKSFDCENGKCIPM